MPIVGYIDPRHKEKKRATGGSTGELPAWLPEEEILELAYHEDPHWSPWSYELLAAAFAEQEDRGDRVSSSALVSACPRSTIIERKEEYVADVHRLWAAFRGTMIHKVLEAAARPNSIAEIRFYAPVGDDEVSCSPDLITEDGELWDYKNTRSVPIYADPWPEHVEQIQFNRWIANNAVKWERFDGSEYDLTLDVRNLKFQHLVIMYLDIDGPKPLEYMESVKVPTTSKYAKSTTKPKRVPGIWDDERVLDRLLPRFHAMRAALDAYPKFPDICQKVWGGPAEWRCPGYPHCPLRGTCLASRYPDGLIW